MPGIPSNLASADPVALWNRLLSPQGVLQMMAINTLNVSKSSGSFLFYLSSVQYFGKLLFWTFMSVVPDASGRSIDGQAAWLTQVLLIEGIYGKIVF